MLFACLCYVREVHADEKKYVHKVKMNAYCLKCKKEQVMKDPKDKTTSNGRKMVSGTCTVCTTKMNKFVKSA